MAAYGHKTLTPPSLDSITSPTLLLLDPELYAKLEAEESKAVKALKAAGRSILYHPVHTVRVCGPLIGP